MVKHHGTRAGLDLETLGISRAMRASIWFKEQGRRHSMIRECTLAAALAIASAIALTAAGPTSPEDDVLSLDCYITSSRGPQAPSTGPVFVRVRFGSVPKVEYSGRVADRAAVSDDLIAFQFDEDVLFPDDIGERGIIDRAKGTFTLMFGKSGGSVAATGHCARKPNRRF